MVKALRSSYDASMFLAYLGAFTASFLWGAGFIGNRYGLEAMGPFWVGFARFFIAFIVCLPFFILAKPVKWNREKLFGIFVCSVFLAGLMIFQIAGLLYTTVAKSGFITILYAFITPMLARIFFEKRLGAYYWTSAAVAFVGVCLLLGFDPANFNKGDALTLGCAFCSAFQILAVGRFAPKFENPAVFNIWQMLGVCLVALPLALVFEGIGPAKQILLMGASHPKALWGLAFMGVFSTGVAFFLQMASQRKIEPHAASLIFLLESPVGAFLGWAALDEILTFKQAAGCAITLAAVGMLPLKRPLQKRLQPALQIAGKNIGMVYARKLKTRRKHKAGIGS